MKPTIFAAEPCIFSATGNHRYTLWRRWSPAAYLNVIGLNPSTANDRMDDPTIRRCIRFAQDWGYGALCMTNLFAWRSKDPLEMKGAANPVGEDNDKHLAECASGAGMVLAAWGTCGNHLDRARIVGRLIARARVGIMCIGFNADGSPKHPLYISAVTRPVEFPVA